MDPFKSSDTSDISLADLLISEQNIWGTALGTLIGFTSGFMLYAFFFPNPQNFFEVVASYFIPGLSMGLFANFMGRGITVKHRLVVLGCGLILFIIADLILEGTVSFGLMTANLMSAALISNRFLTREQSNAVFDYQIGIERNSH